MTYLKNQILSFFISLGLVTAIILVSYLAFKNDFFLGLLSNKQAHIEIDWQSLGEFDYITGSIPPNLSSLNNQYVKIPGFMVPLEDDQKKVTQFLLVSNPQACIHVPPPPPNQMVLVDIPEGTEVVFGPIWVHGTFNIKTKSTEFGDASYYLKAQFVEAYQ